MFILGRKHAVRSWHGSKATVHVHLQAMVIRSNSPSASRYQTQNLFHSSPHKPAPSNTTDTSTLKPPDVEQGIISKVVSTIKHFNGGISRLKNDFLTSLHIREAEATRIHLARKIQNERGSRLKRGVSVDSGEYTSFDERREKWLAKHIPTASLRNRRSKLHLTQLTKDLQTTLPTVLGFLVLPGVGYAFLFLGVMFPRFLLSRQFHTEAQRREWGMEEYRIRREWYGRLNGDFWGSFLRRAPQLIPSHYEAENTTSSDQSKSSDTLSHASMDAAGPVFDEQSMLRLYDLCDKLGSSKTTHLPTATALSNLPVSHLHSISLACNLSSVIPLPSPFAAAFLQYCVPRTFLETKLITVAEEIIIDDLALVEEGQIEACCSDLSNDEVLDACSIRGLPVGRFVRDVTGSESSEIQFMRASLTNHLRMVRVMMHREKSSHAEKRLRDERSLVRDDALKLLVLHLPSLRAW